MFEIVIISTTDPVTKVTAHRTKVRRVENNSVLVPCPGVVELIIENINPVITGKLTATKAAHDTWVPDFQNAFPWMAVALGKE